MRPRMTHEEHVEFATEVREAKRLLDKIRTHVANSFPLKHVAVKHAARAAYELDQVRCALDSEFCRVTTEAQMRETGYVYYTASKAAMREDEEAAQSLV